LKKTLETSAIVDNACQQRGRSGTRAVSCAYGEDYVKLDETNFRAYYWAMQIFLPPL
jgi:hypothetical protein